jgi:hypothetical protein
MEIQTMVEMPLIFFITKSIIDKILALDWRGCFGQGRKWDVAPLGVDFALGLGSFTLWPSKSRDRGSSWPKVMGLWA